MAEVKGLTGSALGMVVGLVGIVLGIFIFGGFASPLLQAMYDMTNVEITLANGSTHLVESPLLTLINPAETVGAIMWGAVVLIFIITGLFSVIKYATPSKR